MTTSTTPTSVPGNTGIPRVPGSAPGALAPPPQPARQGATSSSRVHGIDGLRAAAALWVVGFHMYAFSGGSVAPGLDFVLRSGSTGVSLFLVLSGLCLYLPYAGGRQHRFGSKDFFLRRTRRLLPAYYVSLLLVLAAHLITDGRIGLPDYSPSQYVAQMTTHATFTHQLFPETFYGLNGAYWSLGLEWELYLTLPLLIVAAVRFGLPKVVAAVFVATAAWRIGIFLATQTGALAPDGVWANVVLANFFLGRWSEFALGMLAAELYRTHRISLRWPLVAGAVVSLALALALPDNPLNHMLFGVVFFTLVLAVLENDNVVARVFSWRPLVAVGVMSYSLYLIHQPIIEAFGRVLGDERGANPRMVFLGMLALSPLVLFAALALFVGVERRSLTAGGSSVPVRDLLFPDRCEKRSSDQPSPSGNRSLRLSRRSPTRALRQRPSPEEVRVENETAPEQVPGELEAASSVAGSAAAQPGRSLRANVASLATSQLITWVLALAWTFVVPRALGPSQMGLLVIATSLTSLLAVAGSLTTRDFIVREMVREPASASGMLSAALLTRAAVIPLLFVAGYVYGNRVGLGAHGMSVMYLTAGAAACMMLIDPAVAAFQATERMQFIAYTDISNKSLNTLGGVLLALAGFGVAAIASFTLLAVLLALLMALFWVHRLTGLGARPAPVLPVLRRGTSYWMVAVFYVGYLWADGFLLGVLVPAEVVGWYGAATRLFTTTMFVATIIATASMPRMIAAHQRGDDAFIEAGRQPFEWVVILGVPIGVGLASVSHSLVPLLFGQHYLESVVPLGVLGLGIPLMYMNIIVGQMFLASGRPRMIGWMLAAASVVNIGLNLTLIPWTQDLWGNGAIGAALALLLTEVVQAGIGVALLGRRLLTATTLRRLGGTVLAAAGMAATVWAVNGTFLVAQIAVGGLTFVALFLLLRVPSASELDLLRGAARRVGARIRPVRDGAGS